MSDKKLELYVRELQSEVLEAAFDSDEMDFQHAIFTSYVLEALTEEGDWPQHNLSFYQADKRGEISAWGIEEATKTLHLAVAEWRKIGVIETLPKTAINDKLNRLATFLKNAINDNFIGEESSEAFGAATTIREGYKVEFNSVRLYFLSNRLPTAKATVPDIKIDGLPVHCELWGLERIASLMAIGQEREPIEVDFIKEYSTAIPCIGPAKSGNNVKIYSAFIPGEILGSIYSQYGSRLLELNVRSYLQAKGNVNKGMNHTLEHEPEMFLPYNNGITATVSKVGLDNEKRIKELVDLQIVNGGQTSASMARALNDDRNLKEVKVHMKLVEVNPEDVKTLVPEISRYTNRQNPVSEADLTSNHKFHVRIEQLSAENPDTSGTIPNEWYYEKNKGSYTNLIATAGTAAKRAAKRERYPSKQKFTKTDLAKYYNTWECLPWIVARGASKSFGVFMINLETQSTEPPSFAFNKIPEKPDQTFFQEVIAKKIIFDRTDTIVRKEDFGGWKAQIVTYTIAYISNRLRGQIDFTSIWKSKDIPVELETIIKITCRKVHAYLTNPPGGQNIGEFCKKDTTWFGDPKKGTTGVKGLKVDAEFTGLTGLTYRKQRDDDENELTEEQEVALAWVKVVNPEEIDSLSLWAKEKNWNPIVSDKDKDGVWQKFLSQMSTDVRTSSLLTKYQAARLLDLYEKAQKDGWSTEKQKVEED